jgi:hypothetical protein
MAKNKGNAFKPRKFQVIIREMLRDGEKNVFGDTISRTIDETDTGIVVQQLHNIMTYRDKHGNSLV